MQQKKSKINLWQLASYLITSIFILWLGNWLVNNWNEIKEITDLNIKLTLLIPPITIASVLLVGAVNQTVISHFGLTLTTKQWVPLCFATTAANHIFPMRAGMGLRGLYLKKYHDFPVTRYVSGIATTNTLSLLLNAAIGFGIVLITPIQNYILQILELIFIAATVACSIILFLPIPTDKTSNHKLICYFEKIYSGFNELKSTPKIILITCLLSTLNTFLFSLRIYIAYSAIGYEVTPMACLLSGTLAALSTVLSITPASLGFREGAIVIAGIAFGIPPEISLIAGSLDRGLSICTIGVLGPIGVFNVLYCNNKTTRL